MYGLSEFFNFFVFRNDFAKLLFTQLYFIAKCVVHNVHDAMYMSFWCHLLNFRDYFELYYKYVYYVINFILSATIENQKERHKKKILECQDTHVTHSYT